MAKSKKEIDWTVVVAGGIGIAVAGAALGYIPEMSGTVDVHYSLMLTSGVMGAVLILTRGNIF